MLQDLRLRVCHLSSLHLRVFASLWRFKTYSHLFFNSFVQVFAHRPTLVTFDIMCMELKVAGEAHIVGLYKIARAIGGPKPDNYFERALAGQECGEKRVLIAETDAIFAGYVMLEWHSPYPPFRAGHTPEMKDLNVAPAYRRRGIAWQLIEECERLAREAGRQQIGIGVGLYADYGPAQRLYSRMAYTPDGRGIVYDGEQVTPGAQYPVDDSLCLMLVKALG